jgi:hypothetical protein
MPEPSPSLETRARFIAKVATVYLGNAALCGLFLWYLLYHEAATVWLIAGIILICLFGLVSGVWVTRAHVQRQRARSRAFYSKLGSEISTTENAAPTAAISVSIGMYTVRETIELTLMSIYWRPRSALSLLLLSLLLALSSLIASWPPSPPQLLLAVTLAIAFNGFFVAMIAAATRRALKRLWQGKQEEVLTISSQGLVLGQRATLPWTSIDRVRETRSWIIFMRGGRRIIALPVSHVPAQSMAPLREILHNAKGIHFQTA